MQHRQPQITTRANMGPLSELLSVQLRRVDILLTRGFMAAESGTNLRSGTISCLGLIVGNPGISQKQLAQFTGTDKSNIVAIVDVLEERKWAMRNRSESDRRVHALFATEAGRNALDDIADQICRTEAGLLGGVTDQELADLSALLNKMHDSCFRAIYPSPP